MECACPFEFLAPVTVVAGHYGAGKTNLSLNLAIDAHAAGARVTLVDLDVVNPYFRSSDHAAELEAQGIRVVSPVFAGSGSNLDVPSLTGAIAPAVEEAWAAAADAQMDSAHEAEEIGEVDSASRISSSHLPSHLPSFPSTLVIIDVGGDDAGAYALGRFAREVAAGPYAFWYVANRFRNLTQTPEDAVAVLDSIQKAAHLQATAVVNNSHLMGETSWEHVKAGLSFGDEAAQALDLPLACTTVPHAIVCRENGGVPSFMSGRRVYSVQRYVRTPWET